MVEPLRHRQTKEAATDMFCLKPPRHISTLHLTDKPPAPEFVAYWTNNGQKAALGLDLSAAIDPTDGVIGRQLGRSVVVVGSEAAFGCVVLLALILQRRDDRGNPDLAVAAVEVGILAPALLRCLRCVHDCSPIGPSVALDAKSGQ